MAARLIGGNVPDEVLVEDWTPGRRLWLKTPGRYSMDIAVEILRWVERFDGVSIPDSGWSSPGHGNLVEGGVAVRFGTIRFSIMCSYDDLFIIVDPGFPTTW